MTKPWIPARVLVTPDAYERPRGREIVERAAGFGAEVVQPLLGLAHNGRTRVPFSVNVEQVAGRFEGGTAGVAKRLEALRMLALAGYPVGLTIAPIMPVKQWPAWFTRELASRLPAARLLYWT